MIIKRILLISILSFYCLTAIAQSKITLTGRTMLSGEGFQGIIVEINSNKIKKKVISGINGNFKFENLIGNETDTVSLRAYYLGYETQYIKFFFPKRDTLVSIDFSNKVINNLNEVKIVGNSTSGTNAYKSVYKINSKDFIKNTRGNKVLATVPNVSIQNEDILVDGRYKAIIFINGIESNSLELKALTAEEIDKFEVIANPSASYNSDFTGSVINVILKTKTNDYFKGSISGTGGIRNDYKSIFPTLSYKQKKFLFTSYYSRVYNTQNIQYDLSRINTDGSFYSQQSVRTPSGFQQALNAKMSFILSEKSKLNLSNDISGYKFSANTKGNYYNSGTTANDLEFTNENSIEKQNRWSIASVYSYNLNPKSTLFVKGKFFKYNNIDTYNIEDANSNSNQGSAESSTKEVTAEIDHTLDGVSLFSKKTSFYSGLKFINRQFDFSSNNFNVNQKVINLFGEMNIAISKRFSSMLGLSLENTDNTNTGLSQNYFYFLPNVNLLYTLGKDYTLRGGYSRKILRPSANNLNNELVFINPGTARQGNKDLKPQVRDYAYIMLGKKLSNAQLSFKLYNESVQNSIIETFRVENDVLISILDNAAKNQLTGINVGITTKIFNAVNTNISTGVEYNKFVNTADYSIIKQNSGFTSRSNINLTSKIIKEKLALSLYGFYNSSIYTLTTETKSYPNLGIDAETNFFKNSLNINLSYNNMFALSARRNEFSKASNFNQRIYTRNNTSNLMLTMSYYFGKKFNSNIKNTTIDNDDIIVK